jgi:diguanylate cyclase (GGDEF)-like protein
MGRCPRKTPLLKNRAKLARGIASFLWTRQGPYNGRRKRLTGACAAGVWLRICGCKGFCHLNRNESVRTLNDVRIPVPDTATVLDTASRCARFLPALRLGYIVNKDGLRAVPLPRRGRPIDQHNITFLEVELGSRARRASPRMAADVSKNLDRAKRYLEKNRVEDAIEAYLAVLDESPQHPEATQALGDLYARAEQPERAAVYYAMFFDLLVDPKDETKALAIYNRFLKGAAQPPERIARYAFLQQKQNRGEEAIEQYGKAAELFSNAGREEDALFCWERIALLDPESLARQLRLAEAAERLGKNALAARAFLRTAQLATAGGSANDALKLLGRAHKLAPQERSVTLLYAEAKLKAGAAAEAAALLEPFSATESDATFLDIFGDALMRAGNLDRAREVLERLLREKNEGIPRLFELADCYAAAEQDGKSVEVFLTLKRRMFADKKQNEFATLMDGVGAKHPRSQVILEFWAALYNELNRESQYFEILIKLFDVYLKAGNVPKAAEAIERLVDIDAYDHRNQGRLEALRGRVDEGFIQRVSSRLTRSAGATTPPTTQPQAAPSQATETPMAVTEEGRKLQLLDDLIVQTEIFLQYSLHAKALERLQRIAAMFPGEEARNARLANLYQVANWTPPSAPKSDPYGGRTPVPAAGVQQSPQSQHSSQSSQGSQAPQVSAPQAARSPAETAASQSTGKTGMYSVETLRDLTKISDINQKIFRQQTPRAMLNTAVNEVGTYMKATRALAVVGAAGRPPEMAAEYCGSSGKPAPGAQVVFLLAHMEKAQPDEFGGLIVEATEGSILSELGLATALGVMITDKETQTPAGMLIVGHAHDHKWRPNEAYFLQAIGDQMLMSVSHTRLRSLVRRMGVSDERTGLLSRSSYQSCLLNEADRSRTQSTPLSLAILQIDRGAELVRNQGEAQMERFLEQLARSLQPMVRQNDVAIKYTSWSLAFILPDTTLPGAQNLAEKLLRAASGLRPPWDSTLITLSAGIVEAVVKPDFDSEDIVTDLINRAEFSMEEARKKGGDTVVMQDTPRV